MFSNTYTTVQVIKQRKSKITSIIRDSKGKYFIAKRIPNNNAQGLSQLSKMKKLRHPNLISILDVITEGDSIYIIEQYCQEGDLGFHMHRRNRRKGRYYPEETIAKWVVQIIIAIDYLHQAKIIHKDIRLQNLFLTSLGNLKVGPMKLCKQIQKQSQIGLAYSLLTTPNYSAPECVQKNIFDQKSDIWAIGCIIEQLCGLKLNNLVQNAQRAIKKQCQSLPLIYSQNLNQIYLNCLNNNPLERPTAHQLLSNQYFLEYIKSFIKKQEGEPVKKRIPIKKYKIHRENQQKTKFQQLKAISIKRKQSGDTTLASILQKKPSFKETLQKKQSINDNKNKQIKISSREDCPYNIKVQAIMELKTQTRYNFDRKSSIQMRRDIQKLPLIGQNIARSHSRQLSKRPSLTKSENQKPNMIKSTIAVANQIQSSMTKSMDVTQNTSAFTDSPKKNMPPKPSKRRQVLKSGSIKNLPSINKHQHNQNNVEQDQKVTPKIGLKQTKKLQQQVKSSVETIFNNLLSVGIEPGPQQQQISFQLEDDDGIRLTSAKNEQQQIADTYKVKLNELIQWMICKYSPNMQTIMQRTMEMDGTFQQLKL